MLGDWLSIWGAAPFLMEVTMALSGPYLVCFDFDETITSGHTHNYLMGKKVAPNTPLTEETKAACLNACGFKNPTLTLNAIRLALQNNHYVAITSFNCFPDIVTYSLQNLGLTESELAKIKFFLGFPTEADQFDMTARLPIDYKKGKELHIAAAMAWAQTQGFSGNAKDIILIDDSSLNIKIATEHQHYSIKAPAKIEEYNKHGNYLAFLVDRIGTPEQRDAFIQEQSAIYQEKNRLLNEFKNILNFINDYYEEKTENFSRALAPEEFVAIKSAQHFLGELRRLLSDHFCQSPLEALPMKHFFDIVQQVPKRDFIKIDEHTIDYIKEKIRADEENNYTLLSEQLELFMQPQKNRFRP